MTNYFGISLKKYENKEIDDCFNYSKINKSDTLEHDDINSIPLNLFNDSNEYFKYLKYNYEIIMISILMSTYPSYMEYFLNIVKNKDIEKYNQAIKDLQIPLSKIKKKRKKRNPVPEYKKDFKYWKKRNANTLSARKSRENKKQKKLILNRRNNLSHI